MILWTNEEINKVLLDLNKKELPFKKYSLLLKNGVPVLLGKGGQALVYEICKRNNPYKRYALKVEGFSNYYDSDNNFIETSRIQYNISFKSENIIKVKEYKELWVELDLDDNITDYSDSEFKFIDNSSNEIDSNGYITYKRIEKKDRHLIKLQFVIMEKEVPIIDKSNVLNIKLKAFETMNITEKNILELAFDIGKALDTAHKNKILHRDIKLENIFYDEKKKIYKLGDFGASVESYDGFAETVVFTKGYVAPEVRKTKSNDAYDQTADIYSFGMMLFVIANGLKFPDSNGYNVNQCQYEQGYVLPYPEHIDISVEFYHILEKACSYDPDDRYQTMDDMLIDIESLLFHNMSMLIRIDNRKYYTLGIFCCIFAAIGIKLFYIPEVNVDIPIWGYIIIAYNISKFVLDKYFGSEKKIYLLDSIFIYYMILLGLYLVIFNVYPWYLVVLSIIFLFSSDYYSLCLGLAMLIMKIVSVYQQLNYIDLLEYSQFSWIVVLLIILFLIISNNIYRDIEKKRNYIRKAILDKMSDWVNCACILFFLSDIILYDEIRMDIYIHRYRILPPILVNIFLSINWRMVGIFGLPIVLVITIKRFIRRYKYRKDLKSV